MKNSFRIIGAAAALSVGFAAQAASQSTTFNVTATVVSACSLSAANLAFGNYDPLSAVNTDGTSTVTVTCSLLTPYNLGISAGTYGSGVSARKMQIGAGTDTLDYSLFRDVLRTLNWGITVGTDTLSALGTGIAVPTTVYGRIGSGQVSAPIGAYSDTVTVTVTY
ncbi:MAG: spore coat U domain-containing protein [Pseudomonadota bacterium]